MELKTSQTGFWNRVRMKKQNPHCSVPKSLGTQRMSPKNIHNHYSYPKWETLFKPQQTTYHLSFSIFFYETLPPRPSHFHLNQGQDLFCNRRLKAGTNRKLQDLYKRLTSRSNSYGMEKNIEKSKAMATGQGEANSFMNRVRVEELHSLKYLRATLSEDGNSMTDIRGSGQAGQGLGDSLNIKFTTKYKLYKSL